MGRPRACSQPCLLQLEGKPNMPCAVVESFSIRIIYRKAGISISKTVLVVLREKRVV